VVSNVAKGAKPEAADLKMGFRFGPQPVIHLSNRHKTTTR
jgi:hypothetical protein